MSDAKTTVELIRYRTILTGAQTNNALLLALSSAFMLYQAVCPSYGTSDGQAIPSRRSRFSRADSLFYFILYLIFLGVCQTP